MQSKLVPPRHFIQTSPRREPPIEVFSQCQTGKINRSTICWTDCILYPTVWENIGFLHRELEKMARRMYVWATLLSVYLLWSRPRDMRQKMYEWIDRWMKNWTFETLHSLNCVSHIHNILGSVPNYLYYTSRLPILNFIQFEWCITKQLLESFCSLTFIDKCNQASSQGSKLDIKTVVPQVLKLNLLTHHLLQRAPFLQPGPQLWQQTWGRTK